MERFSKPIQKYTSCEELDSFMLHELIAIHNQFPHFRQYRINTMLQLFVFKICRSDNLKVCVLPNHLSGLYFVPVTKHKNGILILISQQTKVVKYDKSNVLINVVNVRFPHIAYNRYWNKTTHIKQKRPFSHVI